MTIRHNRNCILDAIDFIDNANSAINSMVDGEHIFMLSIISVTKELNKRKRYLQGVADNLSRSLTNEN